MKALQNECCFLNAYQDKYSVYINFINIAELVVRKFIYKH